MPLASAPRRRTHRLLVFFLAALTLAVVLLLLSAFAHAAPPPAPTITSPRSGAMVRGVVAVVATPWAGAASSLPASSTIGSLSVDDGASLATTALPGRFDLDTRQLEAGRHIVGVRSIEPTLSAEATRAIVVDNSAPRLKVRTPVVRVAVGGKAWVSWLVSDVVTTSVRLDVAVSNSRQAVVRRARLGAWGTPRGRAIAWTWDGKDRAAHQVPRGFYLVTVAARDAAGNLRSRAATSTVVQGRYVVVIDPGHQGSADLRPEPIGPGSKVTKPRVAGGATGVASHLPEPVVTLAVALKLEKLLKARGFAVVMCRRTQSVDISNAERARMANRAHADLFIRIHLDGIGDHTRTGTSMLYPVMNKWTKPIAARSKSAAVVVQRYLVRSLGLPNRGLSARGDMSGFNWAKVPVILPEMAFMSNARDDRLMASQTGQTKAAKGLAAGIEAWLTR